MISIFTTLTNPDKRQDPWKEALANYCELADEVIVVNGGEKLEYPDPKVKFISYPWKDDWEWETITKHMNAGLVECKGDWAIRMDIDMLFHENYFAEIKANLNSISWQDKQVLSFTAFNVTTWDKVYVKGARPIAINRGKFPEIRLGRILNEFSDLCYPIIPEGKDEGGIYFGLRADYHKTGIPYLNYDNTFRTKKVAGECWKKYLKAYGKFCNKFQGLSEEEGFKVLTDMIKGRYDKSQFKIKLEEHPKHIRDRVKNLTEEQLGYNLWNLI